jgi:hypothetical protein
MGKAGRWKMAVFTGIFPFFEHFHLLIRLKSMGW